MNPQTLNAIVSHINKTRYTAIELGSRDSLCSGPGIHPKQTIVVLLYGSTS